MCNIESNREIAGPSERVKLEKIDNFTYKYRPPYHHFPGRSLYYLDLEKKFLDEVSHIYCAHFPEYEWEEIHPTEEDLISFPIYSIFKFTTKEPIND